MRACRHNLRPRRKSAKGTDWAQVVEATRAGVEITLSLDNDPAGESYGRDVGNIIKAGNPAAVVRVLRLAEHIEGFPKGGDFADYAAEFRDGQDAESIRAEFEGWAVAAPTWVPVVAEAEPAGTDGGQAHRTATGAASPVGADQFR